MHALFGCRKEAKNTQSKDPDWEKAHATALSVIELINVKRAAPDRSYYYPREVADCDSDGVYEAIVGWHPNGGPEGTDLLWRVVGDTMLMSPDSALLWHEGARMHFDADKLIVTYPHWIPNDSICCPSRTVNEGYRISDGVVAVISSDTIVRDSLR
jgi:hypothetical protein